MSIGHALSNAMSGLDAAAKRSEIVANNLANATTEGYARQSISTSQVVLGDGRGAGVRTEGVERAADPRLTAARRLAQADADSDGSAASALRRIADSVGGADDSDSLFNRITTFETRLRGLSESPQSSGLQLQAADAAREVAAQFNLAAEDIQQERARADGDIGRAVESVNTALLELEKLNRVITAQSASGGDLAGYRQLRDDALDTLSQHLPIRVIDRNAGQISVVTDQGATLLDQRAHLLEFNATPVVDESMDYRAGIGPLSGLSVDGIELSPQGGSQALTRGGIAGLFEVRDALAPDAAAQLDLFALDFASRFEQAGLTDASGRGLFTDGGAALSGAPAQGLAGRLTLSAAVDPAQGGVVSRLRDGLDAATPGNPGASGFVTSLLDTMSAAQTSPALSSVQGSYGAQGFAAEFSTTIEQQAQVLENRAAGSAARFSAMETQELTIEGVDIDQELQSLLAIEQAYSANARIIQVADRMIQRLLEI